MALAIHFWFVMYAINRPVEISGTSPLLPVVMPGWDDNGKTNVEGLMKHFDYSPFMFDPEYCKARCEKEEFQCPNKKRCRMCLRHNIL